MNFNHLAVLSALFFATATLAQARQDPTPPPSGIVVHLFGPDSILSNVLPSGPGSPRPNAPAGPSGASSNVGQPGGTEPSTTATTAPSTASPGTLANGDYPDPGWHDVLHQMFVTGDPNHPPQPAPGRAADRPAIR